MQLNCWIERIDETVAIPLTDGFRKCCVANNSRTKCTHDQFYSVVTSKTSSAHPVTGRYKRELGRSCRITSVIDERISTGPLEGVNNKIRTLQRTAYGYRDKVYFHLKLYALHTTHYALIG